MGFAVLVDVLKTALGLWPFLIAATAHTKGKKGKDIVFVFSKGSWLEEIWPDFPKTEQASYDWGREGA